MINKNIKILFMGTPEFAVPALNKLISANFNITSVITQPDKPVGRKQILTASPIKELAFKKNLPLFQPKSLKGSKAIEAIKKINPDLIIVVAYGKIIPKSILNIPKYGCINIHPSLLPKYRGPSPIQSAILNGEGQTGVTIMLLDEGMDSGPILTQEKIKLSGTETAGELHDKLAILGAEMLVKVIPNYISKKIKPKAQDEKKATICKIITRKDGRIDWNKSAKEIERQFRAFHPWPGVFTFWNNKRLKITDLKISPPDKSLPRTRCGGGQGGYKNKKAGEVYLDEEKLTIACANGSIRVNKVQLEGKKEMNVKNFLEGNSIRLFL